MAFLCVIVLLLLLLFLLLLSLTWCRSTIIFGFHPRRRRRRPRHNIWDRCPARPAVPVVRARLAHRSHLGFRVAQLDQVVPVVLADLVLRPFLALHQGPAALAVPVLLVLLGHRAGLVSLLLVVRVHRVRHQHRAVLVVQLVRQARLVRLVHYSLACRLVLAFQDFRVLQLVPGVQVDLAGMGCMAGFPPPRKLLVGVLVDLAVLALPEFLACHCGPVVLRGRGDPVCSSCHIVLQVAAWYDSLRLQRT